MPWLGGPGLRQGEGLMAPFLPTPPCGPGRASGLSRQPNFGGEPSRDWWDLCSRARLLEARPVDTGAAQQQHRGQAGRDWQHGAAQSPLLLRPSLPPSWRELGERSQATRCPQTDAPRPCSTATHRASRRVYLPRGSWSVWRHLLVPAPVSGRWAGPGGGGEGGPTTTLRSHSLPTARGTRAFCIPSLFFWRPDIN